MTKQKWPFGVAALALKKLPMTNRKWLFGGAAIALVGIALLVRGFWTTDGAAARLQGQVRAVPVEVALAERKPVPVRIDALGSVTPMASVAIKARVDTAIVGVHFRDGAHVEKGDLLFTLDGRQIEADMKRFQAVIDGAQATLEQAQRDVERYTDLVARNATPIVTLIMRRPRSTCRVPRRNQTAPSSKA
jgi:membrane fusion protein, multidrug efflux system